MANITPPVIVPRIFVGKGVITAIKKTTPFPPPVTASSTANLTLYQPEEGITYDPFDYDLCAPYPPCHPLGCGDWKSAPSECEACNVTTVAMNIVGLCLLALLIVITNVLIIVIITRTPALQRRHGYIKVSLAASDLLVGLFVIPAAIYNISTTIFLAPRHHTDDPRHRLEDFVQINSTGSVLFGTIFIISVTSSVYNLLLLTIDRFLAVVRPLQNRSGKYFSRRRLSICIGVVWLVGVAVSLLPAMIPNKFIYVMDPTTFFFVQGNAAYGSTDAGVGPLALFSLVILGFPYLLIVALNLTTLGVTCKRLKARERLGSVGGRSLKNERKEQRKRAKILLDTYPEMSSNGTSSSILNSWYSMRNKSNNNSNDCGQPNAPGRLSKERLDSASSAFVRRQKYRKPQNIHSKVTKMILSMVGAFSACIIPYVVVNILLGTGDLKCANVASPYIVSTYLVIINSAVNFFLYNLWHKEFRSELKLVLTCVPQYERRTRGSTYTATSSSSRPMSGNSWPIVKNVNHSSPHYALGVSSFQQSA